MVEWAPAPAPKRVILSGSPQKLEAWKKKGVILILHNTSCLSEQYYPNHATHFSGQKYTSLVFHNFTSILIINFEKNWGKPSKWTDLIWLGKSDIWNFQSKMQNAILTLSQQRINFDKWNKRLRNYISII